MPPLCHTTTMDPHVPPSLSEMDGSDRKMSTRPQVNRVSTVKDLLYKLGDCLVSNTLQSPDCSALAADSEACVSSLAEWRFSPSSNNP